jgi:hypothetical protein
MSWDDLSRFAAGDCVALRGRGELAGEAINEEAKILIDGYSA